MRIAAFALALVLAPAVARTETNLLVSSGIVYPIGSMSTYTEGRHLADNWSPGLDFGVGLEQRLTGRVGLFSSIEYSHLFFDRYAAYQAIIPEARILASRGGPASLYRTLLGARLHSSKHAGIQAHVSTGAGYVLERPGAIEVLYSDTNVGGSTARVQYPDADYWVHTFGFGVRVPAGGRRSLDLSLRYDSDYETRFQTHGTVGFVIPLDR
jgi:hypothetical protein